MLNRDARGKKEYSNGMNECQGEGPDNYKDLVIASATGKSFVLRYPLSQERKAIEIGKRMSKLANFTLLLPSTINVNGREDWSIEQVN